MSTNSNTSNIFLEIAPEAFGALLGVLASLWIWRKTQENQRLSHTKQVEENAKSYRLYLDHCLELLSTHLNACEVSIDTLLSELTVKNASAKFLLASWRYDLLIDWPNAAVLTPSRVEQLQITASKLISRIPSEVARLMQQVSEIPTSSVASATEALYRLKDRCCELQRVACEAREELGEG